MHLLRLHILLSLLTTSSGTVEITCTIAGVVVVLGFLTQLGLTAGVSWSNVMYILCEYVCCEYVWHHASMVQRQVLMKV